MTDGRVIYNGVPVHPDWPAKMEESQKVTVHIIDGIPRDRIRYGEESDDWGANERPCHDCAAVNGQYHALGCDVERCPVCDSQAICCDCNYQGDETDASMNRSG